MAMTNAANQYLDSQVLRMDGGGGSKAKPKELSFSYLINVLMGTPKCLDPLTHF